MPLTISATEDNPFPTGNFMDSSLAMDFQKITDILGGDWLLPTIEHAPKRILDDSRLLQKGDLFVAIDGREYGLTSDGHNYLSQAASAQVAAVIVQRKPTDEILALLKQKGCGCLLVKNGLRAFQALARLHRESLPFFPLVAITGSCGKTSTKEMIAAILTEHFSAEHVVKTTGNTNNDFGVPRNLLRLSGNTHAAVIEAGTNHPGEIQRLAEMIQPLISVVSNIGAAHLEAFHDFNGIAEEKGDLFQYTTENGVCILPDACAGKEILLKHAGNRRVITFGLTETADVQTRYLGPTNDGKYRILLQTPLDQIVFDWSIPGECQASNAAAAAAVGLSCGISLMECANGLQNCVLPGARLAETDLGGIHWVNDAYNANPTSVKASLSSFRDMAKNAPSPKYLILGDMKELGDNSPTLHQETLALAKKLFPNDTIITVGELFAPWADKLGLTNFENADVLAKSLIIPPQSWVFLKASHSLRLDRIPELITTK